MTVKTVLAASHHNRSVQPIISDLIGPQFLEFQLPSNGSAVILCDKCGGWGKVYR